MCKVIEDMRSESFQERLQEGRNLLASTIQRLRHGESPEDIRQSGIDDKTLELALSCQ